MYLNNYDIFLVYLKSGHIVEGQFHNLKDPILLEGLHPSIYLEFKTLEGILHLNRSDIQKLEAISDFEEVDYDVPETTVPKEPAPYQKVYSMLLQDIMTQKQAGIGLVYTLYGMLGQEVGVPLSLQTREPGRPEYSYYILNLGAFNRGIIYASGYTKNKVHPTTGTVLVAIKHTYSAKHKPIQVSGYLEQLPSSYGANAYVLKQMSPTGANKEASAVVYDSAGLEGKRQERQMLNKMITTPGVYNISNIQPEIGFGRYKVTYGYDTTGATIKRALRRPRAAVKPSSQSILSQIISDKSIVDIEKVFAHHMVALDAQGLIDEYKVYNELLTLMVGSQQGEDINPGIKVYKMGTRKLTVYLAGFTEDNFVALYEKLRKKASTSNTYVFIGFNLTEKIALPHIRVQDLHNL